VPVFEAPSEPTSFVDLGTAEVRLEVGLVGVMTFGSGWASLEGDPGERVVHIRLYPGSGPLVDWDKMLVLELPLDATYQAGTEHNMGTSGETRGEYHEETRVMGAVARDVLRAEVVSGTLRL